MQMPVNDSEIYKWIATGAVGLVATITSFAARGIDKRVTYQGNKINKVKTDVSLLKQHVETTQADMTEVKRDMKANTEMLIKIGTKLNVD